MLGTMAQRTTHDAPAANRFARSGVFLLVGTLVSNLLSYAFFAVLSRRMSPADLGAVGSMINLSVIAGIPALGLQLVAARLVARRAHDRTRVRDLEIRLLKAAFWLGVTTAALLTVASPLLAIVLDITVGAALVLAVGMVPLAVLLAAQGLLQGRERFIALSAALALVGVGKVAAALLANRVGPDATAVVGLYVLGLLLVALFCLLLVLFDPVDRAGRAGLTRPLLAPPPGATARLVRLVAAAVVPTSGLLFLVSVDVLLARHELAAADSGHYTIGALFEKAAFWGMSFLATLFYPAMAHEARRRAALVRALTVTAGLGLVGTAGTAAVGNQLATLVGGPSFTSLGADLWRFVAFGVALALVQVLAYAGVAAASMRMGVAMWVVSTAAVTWVAMAGKTVSDVVTIMLICAIGLVAAGLYIERGTLLGGRVASRQ